MTLDIPSLREDFVKGEQNHPEQHNIERRALKQLHEDFQRLHARVALLEQGGSPPPPDPNRRYALYADDYDSVQAALDDAVSRKLPTIYLNPASTYDIGATLVIPASVTLDGGGAVLKASTALDPMVEMSGNRGRIKRCNFNANRLCAVTLLVRRHFISVESCTFGNFANATDIAIKAGGALYPRFVGNTVFNSPGWGLDALASYGGSYYGINHGYSEQNVWGARMGAMRVEGMLTSQADDFETTLDGESVVTCGGTVQSQLTLNAPYFELAKGNAAHLRAITAKGSARLIVRDGEAFGDSDVADRENSRFLHLTVPDMVVVTGMCLSRWHYGIVGNVANNAVGLIAANYALNTTTKYSIGNLANAKVSVLDS